MLGARLQVQLWEVRCCCLLSWERPARVCEEWCVPGARRGARGTCPGAQSCSLEPLWGGFALPHEG